MSSNQSSLDKYLGPTESLQEVLFGLIMVLSFTLGAGLIVEEGPGATSRMLWGTLTCNIAWGLIDGGMYLMTCMLDRNRKARLLERVQKATTEDDALVMIGAELDKGLEPLTSPEERKHVYHAVLERLRSVQPERTRLTRDDLLGAIACFFLVLLSTIPAIVPFLLFRDRFVALRVSNALLLAMLFVVGYHWARATHANTWLFGSALFLVGLVMVATAMAFGG